jgi:hypothetical protein
MRAAPPLAAARQYREKSILRSFGRMSECPCQQSGAGNLFLIDKTLFRKHALLPAISPCKCPKLNIWAIEDHF